jgi:succinate-acetate transporter protein
MDQSTITIKDNSANPGPLGLLGLWYDNSLIKSAQCGFL